MAAWRYEIFLLVLKISHSFAALTNLAWNWCYIIALYIGFIHLSAMLQIFWTVAVFSGIKNK